MPEEHPALPEIGPHGHQDSEAPLVSRCLVLATEGTHFSVSAEEAWSAAVASRDVGVGWVAWVRSTAAMLGLRTSVDDAGLDPGEAPAITRTAAQQWWVICGRRGRLVRVYPVGAQTEKARWMTCDRARSLAPGQPWIHLQPMFMLDAISARKDPSLAHRPWDRLRAFLGLESREIGVIVVYALVIGALTLTTPVAVQALVNTVAFGAVLQPLVALTVLLFGGLAFSGALTVLESYVVEVLQRRIFVRVADDFGRRLPRIEAEALDGADGPELVNRFFDVLTIQKSLAALLLDSLALSLQMAVGMLLLGFYHPILLAFDAILIVVLIGILFLGRGAIATGVKESSAKYRAVAWLEDVVRVARVTRSGRAQHYVAERTEMMCRDYLAARKKHFRILLRQLAGGVGLQVMATVALLGVGGWLVIGRQLTLGQLVAAELVVAAMGSGFVKVGRSLEKVYDLNVGVLKLAQVVDLPSERRGGVVFGEGEPAGLTVRGLEVVRNHVRTFGALHFEIEAGDRVRLAGSAASGKSTLLEVLAGLRRPTAGSVQVDGYDLRGVDLGSYRDRVSLVRGTEFITGTIAQNLGLDGRAVDDAQLRPMLKIVGLEPAIDRLPKGIHTPLLPSGAPLSESQARRLVLVRAWWARPRLMLLDRALDGLGLSNEELQALVQAILGPQAPWIALVVTDEPIVAAACNRTLTLTSHGMAEEA